MVPVASHNPPLCYACPTGCAGRSIVPAQRLNITPSLNYAKRLIDWHEWQASVSGTPASGIRQKPGPSRKREPSQLSAYALSGVLLANVTAGIKGNIR